MANRRTDIIDKADSIAYHLEGLRELAMSLPEDGASPAIDFEDAELRAFARWALDVLGFEEGGDVSEDVRAARPLLVGLLARHRPRRHEEREDQGAGPTEADFVDLFEGEDPSVEADEELAIEPMLGEQD